MKRDKHKKAPALLLALCVILGLVPVMLSTAPALPLALAALAALALGMVPGLAPGAGGKRKTALTLLLALVMVGGLFPGGAVTAQATTLTFDSFGKSYGGNTYTSGPFTIKSDMESTGGEAVVYYNQSEVKAVCLDVSTTTTGLSITNITLYYANYYTDSSTPASWDLQKNK